MDMGPYISHIAYFFDSLDNKNRRLLCDGVGMIEYRNTIVAERLLHIPLSILIVEFPI